MTTTDTNDQYNRIEFGECREVMKRYIDEGLKIQTCVTSPPYYGLRDYGTGSWEGGDPNCNHYRDTKVGDSTTTGHAGMEEEGAAVGDAIYKDICKKCGAKRVDQQIGLEESPEAFVDNLVDVFRSVRELLHDDGTLWVNLGDSYYNYRKTQGEDFAKQTVASNRQDLPHKSPTRSSVLQGLKNKDLIGVPWMFAFAMRADGWYLRQDIIWSKPNPMPESVRDRCTKAHEYIFLFSKKPQYFFDDDAIKTKSIVPDKHTRDRDIGKLNNTPGKTRSGGLTHNQYETAKKRSVWTVNTKPYPGSHFAVYPEELIEPCILAGSRFGDVVFDPFMGSGTTAAVAIKNGRQFLGTDLNPDYKPLQDQRIAEAKRDKPPIIEGDPNSLFVFE